MARKIIKKSYFENEYLYIWFDKMYEYYVNLCFRHDHKPEFSFDDIAYCVDHENPCLSDYSFYDKDDKFLFRYID